MIGVLCLSLFLAHQYPPNLGALGVTMFIDDGDDGDGGPSQGWLSESEYDFFNVLKMCKVIEHQGFTIIFLN